MNVRIPRYFMTDHEGRDLPTPEAVKVTRSHFWIDLDDPATEELLADAEFYADPCGPVLEFEELGLRRSAEATARAIRVAMEERDQG